jgi:hypothetical protein
VRRRVTVSTRFSASVEPTLRTCAAPSAAPAGCRSETVSPPNQASAFVRIRGAREAKLVPRARDQALARRATLRAEDFPTGWQGVVSSDPFFPCHGFEPDLSKLTVHGEASSLVFLARDAQAAVWTTTEVYTSDAEARIAFSRSAKVDAARCIAKEAASTGATVVSVGSVRFARVGDGTRAFRIVLSDSEGTYYGDVVYVRRDRVLMRMGFVGVEDASELEVKLARGVVARAR